MPKCKTATALHRKCLRASLAAQPLNLHRGIGRDARPVTGVDLLPADPGADIPREAAELLLNPGVWRVEVKTQGDPKWYRNQATYEDYFEAVAWAMVTLERWSAAEDTRIVPVETGITTTPTRASDPADPDHPPAA